MYRPRIGQAAASEIPSFRPYKTACAPKTSGIKVKTVFRHLKEGASPDFYTWTSNPYRGTAASGWTRTRADQLGRVVEVGHFSGAGRPSTGSPPALGATASPNQATSYGYNALDNLTRVTQGAQARTFAYDSLSRLTSATNPESGTIAYAYDNNGNLTQRTDARGVVTAYTYDGLDRLTRRSYSYTGTSTAVSLETTRVDYDYDNCGAYSEGRLCSVTAKKGTAVVSTTAYANYDALGRVGKSTQTMGVTDYEMFYTYDRAGNLTSQTYPSGKVVETVYDEVGRVAGVKRGGHWYAGEEAGETGAVGYGPHGGIRELRLGNGFWEQRRYNARLQPTQIGLGTVEATGGTLTATGMNPTAGLLLLNYSYGTTANNGNVVSQQIQVGSSLDQTQSYTYDKLNRLKTATETGSGTGWMRTYQYDRYGNRAVTGADSYLPMTDRTLTPQALTSFNASSNRLNGLVAYDGAGNLTQDWAGRNFKYDGDNRMVDFRFTAGGLPTHVKYRYDGDGRRIRKEVVGGRTTTYVYNAAGQLVAEYAGTVPAARRYLTPDHLGSTRVVTAQEHAQNQGVLTRHDYLPFGQEIEPNRGNRSSVSGYTADLADGPAQKFTGKERDTESRLDYFQARYFSGAGGRFTSADAPLADQLASDPQSWNLYVYSRNNPLRFIDPTGRTCVANADGTYSDVEGPGGTCEDALRGDVAARDDPDVTVTEDAPPSEEFQAVASGVESAAPVVYALYEITMTFVGSAIPVPTGRATAAGATGFWGAVRNLFRGKGTSAARRSDGATGFLGSKRIPLKNVRARPPRNTPTTINGRKYSGHALDQMQNRGFTPTVIENAIKTGVRTSGNSPGTTAYIDMINKIRVVVNLKTGKVVTTIPGIQ